MASNIELRGVFVPLITPFDARGEVAVDVVEQLCSDYLDAGAAGIVALGTTGEAPALDDVEKSAVIAACAKVCASRSAPLIVGAGSNNTRASVAAVKELEGVPALAAVLSVVPYYVRPSEAGIVEHYRAVAAASPAPLVIYNVPYRTGQVLKSPGMLELARTANITGVKQAVGGIDADTLEILAGAPDGFAMLCGDDYLIAPLVLMGATGGITASAHVCTERFAALVDCALAGKIDEVRAHAEALLPITKLLFAEPNPAVTKGVLHAQGKIPTPDLRLPMTAASTSSIDAALTAIDAAGAR
jgi:4-hydroxy-tetrahydrodipicolinate synthase